MRISKKLLALTPLCALLAAGSAHATNGYFSHGYGIKAKGMGGASVAMTDNAFAGANNPAAAAWAGNRVEVGLDVFAPSREMERTGSLADTAVKSDSNIFYVPEFGFNGAVSDSIGMGITVYGNGGMNTDYAGGQLGATCGGAAGTRNVLCGTTRLGVDLQQLIVAPTIAFKIGSNNSIGVSPLIVQQVFKADGLQAFTGAASTQDPANVTNNGYDTSTGYGVRLGYLGKLSDSFSAGASYSPQISMSKFGKYAGLYAEAGGFDIPANYSVGVAFNPTPDVTVAIDYQRIVYSGVKSVSNASSVINTGVRLGTVGGSGFGWSDVGAFKLGVQWKATGSLTMRVGVNVGDNPIKSADATFNILAPGVVTTHYTAGGTYAMSKSSDVSFSYMYAPSNSVSGASLTALGQNGTDTIRMSQQAIGIQFGWHWK
jgi:long-chain fatty acid transport protein